jgi:O-antigen/teichoic acid export membrane protein
VNNAKSPRNALSIALMSIARIVTRAAQAVAFVVLARTLNPTGFGTYSLITTSIFMAGQIGNLGLRQSSALLVGRNELSAREATYLLLLIWPVITALSAIAVLWVNYDLLSALSSSLIFWISLAVGASLLLSLLQGVFLGLGDIKYFTMADAFPRVLLAITAVLLATMNFATLETTLIAFAFSFAMFVPAALRRSWGNITRVNTKLWPLATMVKAGILFAVSAFCVTLNSRVGLYLIERYASAAISGTFFAAVRFTEIFLEFATIVGLVLFSSVVRAKDGEDALKSAYGASVNLFWLFACICVLVELGTGPLIHLLLGSAYAGAVPFVHILALSLAPAAATKSLNGAMLGTGRPYITTLVVAVGLVLNLVISWLGLLQGNLMSVAYGAVISQWATLVLYLLVLRFNFKHHLYFLPPAGTFQQLLLRISKLSMFKALHRT